MKRAAIMSMSLRRPDSRRATRSPNFGSSALTERPSEARPACTGPRSTSGTLMFDREVSSAPKRWSIAGCTCATAVIMGSSDAASFASSACRRSCSGVRSVERMSATACFTWPMPCSTGCRSTGFCVLTAARMAAACFVMSSRVTRPSMRLVWASRRSRLSAIDSCLRLSHHHISAAPRAAASSMRMKIWRSRNHMVKSVQVGVSWAMHVQSEFQSGGCGRARPPCRWWRAGWPRQIPWPPALQAPRHARSGRRARLRRGAG